MIASHEFDDRVARLKEHLVEPTAEDELEEAERRFAEEGDTVWTRLALLRAESSRNRERLRASADRLRRAMKEDREDDDDDL